MHLARVGVKCLWEGLSCEVCGFGQTGLSTLIGACGFAGAGGSAPAHDNLR